MEFTDRTLICIRCREQFVFSAGEQLFFKEKRFEHEPKCCKKCKAKSAHMRVRAESSVICGACGGFTIVPFLPRQGRPVLCRQCLDRQRHIVST